MPALPAQPGRARAPAPYAARFRAGDLRRVRQAVAEWAARAGLRGQRAGEFVIAVHEIAANAVRHGSPTARLGLHVAGATMVQAEVCDSGRWPPGPVAAPALGQGGLGLQLVRRVCDEVTIRRSPAGNTVIVRMNLPRTAHRPTVPLNLSASTPGRPEIG